MLEVSCILALQMIMISTAYSKWVTTGADLAILIPCGKDLVSALCINLDRHFETIKNKYGDKWSPCLKPHWRVINPNGEPYNKIKYVTVETH